MSIARMLIRLLLLVLMPLHLAATTVHVDASYSSNGIQDSKALGPQPTIAILVEFRDLKHQRSKEDIASDIFWRLNSYVTEASYNVSWVVGDLTDWVELTSESSFYGRDFGPFIDVEVRALIDNSLRAADPMIDFRLYRHIIIVHAGLGQETTGNPSDIWSGYMTCKPPLHADGLLITNAIIVPELEAREIDPLGIYAHEFMHSLGLPDLYPDSTLRKSKHMEAWDIMDKGLRNGEPKGSSPAHPSAWSKMLLCWPVRTRTVYSGSIEEIMIGPLESRTEYPQAVILPIVPGKYYIIEVRLRVGFDRSLPSRGVLLTAVDERRTPTGGMVKVVDADPSTPHLNNAPFQVGQHYIDEPKLVRIAVTAESGEGFKVLVDRMIPTEY
ncbi:immune inhibitor A [Candidatus Bathyarchaeota archaeon]|nr:immune inhibitor A [Candidatus Bathyarchaeota archaeon]